LARVHIYLQGFFVMADLSISPLEVLYYNLSFIRQILHGIALISKGEN
jgi:hypothetical protein